MNREQDETGETFDYPENEDVVRFKRAIADFKLAVRNEIEPFVIPILDSLARVLKKLPKWSPKHWANMKDE